MISPPLPEQHHAAWLGEAENGNLKELLVPYPADQMRMNRHAPIRTGSAHRLTHSIASGVLTDLEPGIFGLLLAPSLSAGSSWS
jgi:hypothetical protein